MHKILLDHNKLSKPLQKDFKNALGSLLHVVRDDGYRHVYVPG